MACIERSPRCGTVSVIQEPIGNLTSIVLMIIGIIGIIVSLLKYEAAAEIVAKIVAWLGGAFFGGALAGFLAAVGVLIIIASYLTDRCNAKEGEQECIAGVVQNIVQDFSGTLEEFLPFTAMHDRIDVVVKSNYWDKVERNAVRVFCTDEAPSTFRQSEIMRCYYYTERVCDAARGALVGGAVGAVGGIIAAAFIAAAIGCATIILCLIAILVAALVAAAAVLIGALIGGQVGKNISDDSTPSDNSGTEISIGDLITVNGSIVTKDYDEGANVVWWVASSSLSGRVPDSTPDNPFSYCEIDEIFMMDGCPVIIL